MKLRMIALAGVAVAALSSPAIAGEGWYLGLGGGYASEAEVDLKMEMVSRGMIAQDIERVLAARLSGDPSSTESERRKQQTPLIPITAP